MRSYKRLCYALENHSDVDVRTIRSYLGRTTSARIRVAVFKLFLNLDVKMNTELWIHLERGIFESCASVESMTVYSTVLLKNKTVCPKSLVNMLIRTILISESEDVTRVSMETLCSLFPDMDIVDALLSDENSRTVLSHCLLSCVNKKLSNSNLRVTRHLIVKASNYFYRTDLNVLVDILLRHVQDLDPKSKLRLDAFRTLLCVISKSNWSNNGAYRIEDIIETMEDLSTQRGYENAAVKCVELLRTWL